MKHLIRNTEQVQALLNGATQFRVPVEVSKNCSFQGIDSFIQQYMFRVPDETNFGTKDIGITSPYKKGDEVFVKEEFRIGYWNNEDEEVALDFKVGRDSSIKKPNSKLFWDMSDDATNYLERINYPQKYERYIWEKYNSPLPFYNASEMTEELSRFKYVITNVYVERFQDISFVDILEMGAPNPELKNFDDMFEFKASTKKIREWVDRFLDSSAKDGFKWEDNPYVFVYDFEIVKGK